MQEFIIIDGLPYLLFCDKAYAVRWDKSGFTVGDVFREGISPTAFPVLSERSVKAKCQGRLDSIGKPQEPEEPPKQEEAEVPQEPEEPEKPKAKRGRKPKGDAE